MARLRSLHEQFQVSGFKFQVLLPDQTLVLWFDDLHDSDPSTLATRYRFRHALHQDVTYLRIPPLKRLQWHQKIGERRERGLAGEVGPVAVELATHFEQSRDYERAVRYLQQAPASKPCSREQEMKS